MAYSRHRFDDVWHNEARAELALVLRAIDALNLRLDTSIGETNRCLSAVDIDAIVAPGAP